MLSYIQRFQNKLTEPIDGRVLGLFRIIFGLFMLYQCSYYMQTKLIDDGFLKPYLLFKYDGFEFIDRFSRPVMFGLLATMAISALFIALGFLMRLASVLFAVIQLYFLLLEKAYYNNHIYLFVLIAILLAFTNADDFYSVKSAKNRVKTIGFWQQWILQAQFVIVYFYAALVKLKPDWLVLKQPMTYLIENYPSTKSLAWLFKAPGMIDAFTYGGFFLDLLAPFLLWYKPVRKYAIIPFMLFHFTNSRIFDDIGIFPYLMACSLIIFFAPSELPILPKAPTEKMEKGNLAGLLAPVQPIKIALISYFIFQLLFPLRGYFLANPLDYTTIGNRFAWRVKADTREQTELTFYATHPESKQKLPVDMKVFLNPVQINLLMQDPRAAVHFAQALKKEGERQGVKDMIVQAKISMRYNGRAPIDFIDPEVNLNTVTYSAFKPIVWVNEPPGI